MGEVLCFRCHAPGHWSANCPERTRAEKAHPPAAPEGAPEKGKGNPGPPPVREVLAAITPTEVAGDARFWASHARQLLGERPVIGPPRYCTDPADIYNSPFRRAQNLGPIHQCQLRQLAAQQIKERS